MLRTPSYLDYSNIFDIIENIFNNAQTQPYSFATHPQVAYHI